MHNFIIVLNLIRACYSYFDLLSLDRPYSQYTSSEFYNYGYWFKYQPLIQSTNNLKFGNSSTYTLQNQYLLGFELRDTNTLSLWHYQTDTFNHIVKIFQKDGIKSFEFQQDQLKYEGEWFYFGIQVINDHQYQILFYSNSLQIITADGILDRLSQQNYYIGCFGQFFDVNGQQIQFQHFQGRLTNFIELYDIISESNFEDIVISDYRYYINSFDTISFQQYFDIQNFNGQLVQKYSHNEYREGIRYGITMWVKSNIEQYTLALNYTILRATLNEYYTDNYLGDKQLLIQYQVGIVPSENIVYVSTYSFMTPIYGLSKKNDKDVIKFQDDEDLISGLKQWHFIQFEYGRSSVTDVSYNSLFILNLPFKEKQFNNDWSRDNHHFTGVPLYFYLGGGLSQYENKFIGIISKFTFISYNTEDMNFKIQCDDSCLTCIGPTSSDCLTCATDQNKVFSLNQCVCKPGYLLNANKLSCQTLSILYPMIQILETAYNCPEGYDQCENEKIVCSFGYFLFENQCFQCPQQPSEYQDNIINCLECVFIPTYWRDYCSTKAQLEGNIFSYIKGDYYYYYPKTLINHDLYLNGYFYPDIYYCQEGYGFNYQTYECNKCFNNCLNCYINQDLTQQCNECPKQYSLTQNICVKCGTYCEQCDQDNCLVCENGSFQTLDKINCIQCSIQNCKFCYQYYQDQEQMLISLDLKYQQIDISTVGIITSCARCEDGYVIEGDRCIQISSLTQFQIQSCLTGILQNDNFQCLIGFDKDTALQLNNCQLIKNCYSCLMRYPIDPWCIQCVNGYYVQLEDGSCVACPDSCAGCIQQNSIYKDSWKVSLRALYFYKFGSHKYEDFAIDNQFKYEIICTECKDNFILFEKSCIPGCDSNCEICEAENGQAVCKKCRDNQYGALRSLDSNFQCIECPHNCNACVTRNSTLWKELNSFLEPSKYFSYDHFCYSYDLSFFLDNELNLPVKCDNSKKCFKSLVITINLYCDLNFQKIISNCQFVNIQVCLQNIFNDGLIDYIKKEVIKEVEIIFILKFSSCTFSKIITISQNLKSQVFSISQITLIIQAPQQTTLRFRNNIIFNNFDNYNINNITIIGTFNIKFEISGKRIKFESIILESFSYYFSQNYFIFNDIISLNINNLTVLADYRIRYKYLIEIRNLSAYTYKTDIVMSNILISQSKFFDQGILSFNIYDVQPTLSVTNLTIISTTFENCFSLFNFTQGVQISSIMKNLSIINNQFLNSSLIQWIQTSGQPVIQLYFKSNEVINSIVIKTPVLDLINSTFIQNQLLEQSILIQSNTLQNQSGSFKFQQLIIEQNYYKFGSQFICINQMENSSISVNFDVYFSIDNVQDFINNQLSYELSLIYINITHININNFTVSRKVGIIELAIIQSQQIYINNLKIENNQKNNIIYGDQQCLQEQQNIIIYIFDTLFIQIDNFQILSLGSIDYSIIVIQSQSVLKKQQNETIVLQNGVISNNQLVVSLFNKQISVIEIVSLQQQEINCRNIIFERNILNVYVQNLQMQSSSTILIQSDQGKVQFDNCQFKQNYVINSTNSPFYIYSNQILIKDTYFTNNNIFDIEIYKKMLVLNYLDKVSIEQIQLRDFPIQSNGGSGSFKAQSIHIQNINIQGSYGLNGGSFYIITVEKSTITINNATIKYSCTSDDINSKGGVIFIDGSKSNLIINLKDIFVSYAKSRQQGGFMYLISLDLSITITNIHCINCFSINGGFIYIDPSIGYDNSVKIINISLSNPDFGWFIQQIINITTEEQAILQRYSFLIYLPESILSVYTLRVTDGNFFGILYFKGNQGLIIQGLLISNYKTFQNSLVTLIHPQVTQDIIKLNDIQIYNISQEKINQIVCKPATMTFDTYQRCQQVEQILQAFSYLTQQSLENNYNCNYQNIYQDLNQSKALFEVFNFTTNKLVIDNMQINNASTRQQDFGIISIRDFNGINNQVQINNIQIINNSCGIYGCLLITSQSSSILDKNKRLLSLYESIDQKTSSILLQNSKFINNQAIYGSGIYVQNISIIIVNTLFMNNSADLLGGAIYLTAYKNSLMLINNQIINNKAANQSGSGVYLNGLSMPKLDGFQNTFLDNQQDFNEIPQKLQIVVNNKILNKFIIKQDSEILIEQVKIVPYQILGQKQQSNVITLPSGQSIKDYQYFDKYNQEYIPYNLSLQFIPINRFEQQLYDQQLDLYISARTNKNNFSKQYFSKNVFTYDNLTQSFNLDDLIIYFSPYEQNNLEIKVESPGIKIPKYSSSPPYDIDSYKSYELRFMIRTFKCQLGQFYNENLQCCEQCTGNTYSVQLNSRICVFKDDNFINEVNSAKIQLKLGYWRAYVFSSKIDPCYHLEENCIGGWGTGDQLCSLGHIGALCEQCDLYDIRGSGSYSVSSEYQCGACSESKGNILSVILISSWTMLSIVMTVQSTIDLVNNQIQKRKLIKLGLNFQDQKPNPAVLIKVLSNYLQIIITITTFQLKVPQGISTVFVSAGNPISTMAYSLDCFLISLTSINIIYFRIIWGILLAFSYIFLYQSGYFILVLLNKTIFNISAVTTCFIYLYVYLQPNLIQSLIQLVSFRNISGQQWIAGNVSYRYDTNSHVNWLITFVVPSLIIIGIMIPIILFIGLYKNRKNLNQPQNRQIWGYLYNEYKLTTYYWETIKIVQKEFIIIVLAYYEDYIPIKAALVFISLFLYSQATQISQPYNQGKFNKIDTQSTTVCAVSIILATTIYTAQSQQLIEIVWPFYIIISTLNTLFLLKLLWILFYAYGQKLESQLDLIRDKIIIKFPNTFDKFPFLKAFLENQQQKKRRIFKRFQLIRQFLIPQAKLIMDIKSQSKNMVTTNSKEKEYRQTSYIQYKDVINSPLSQENKLLSDEVLIKNQTQNDQ